MIKYSLAGAIMMRLALVLATLCVAASVELDATQQRWTIPQEVARVRPQPVRCERIVELVDVRLDELFDKGDVIVHGIASIATTRLSENQREVYTDFTIIPRRIMRQRVIASGQRPGVAEPLVFTQFGGKLLYDGVVVECFDKEAPLVENGAEGIFFLTPDRQLNRYRLVGDGAGALIVKSNRIVPLMKSPILDEVRGRGLAEMIKDVEARIGRSR